MRYRISKISVFVGFILALTLFACEEKKEKAVILLSPFDLYISARPAEVVVIAVNCQSPVEMKQLVIKSRLEGSFSATELDTLISGNNFYLQYEYMVPDIVESTKIILEFYLLDASNATVSNFRVIDVKTNEVYLTETAGHEMFSGNSGKQNGYNLLTGTPEYLHLTDSSVVHIADTTKNDTLLNRWISPAGVRFVRFNGFDYANSTNITAKAAFNAGLKNDFINNVSDGDIYICKIINSDMKEVYVALKIADVLDKQGSESDRYVFNIKR